MEALTVDRADVLAFRFRRHQLEPGARLGRGRRRRPPRHSASRTPAPSAAPGRSSSGGARPAGPDDLLLGLDDPTAHPTPIAATSPPSPSPRRPTPRPTRRARVFDASKPLRQAGIGTLDALRTIARQIRDIVRRPMTKGDVSSRAHRPPRPAVPTLLPVVQRDAQLRATVPSGRPASRPRARAGDLAARAAPHPGAPARALQAPRHGGGPPLRPHPRLPALLRSRTRQGHRHLPRRPGGRGEGASARRHDRGDDRRPRRQGQALCAGRRRRRPGRRGASAPATGVVRLVGSHDPYLQLRDRDLLVADGPSRKTSGASLAVPAPCWSTARWRAPGGPARRAAP